MSNHDFDSAVESYQQALVSFLKGDAGPVLEHFSEQDDVTLANPLGAPRLGRAAVEQAVSEASSHFEDGYMDFEEISRVATPDLGYVVWIERGEVRLVGTETMAPSSLRVTMIFRREGDTWKVAHRHADPITSDRPVSIVLET